MKNLKTKNEQNLTEAASSCLVRGQQNFEKKITNVKKSEKSGKNMWKKGNNIEKRWTKAPTLDQMRS